MDSDVGTLLFVTSLLGAGGLGLYYYGNGTLNLEGDNDYDDNKESNEVNIKEDELEELDESFFTPPTRSRRTNINANNNRSKKAGKRVRFNTRRRY
jgi:hypothetical protein